MSIPISQSIPPPLFPFGIHTFILYFCFANKITYTILLDFTYMYQYMTSVFLFLTYFTLYDTLYIHLHLYK